MSTLRVVLTDQLSRSLSSLRDVDRVADVVLMAEAPDQIAPLRCHKQKVVLLLSAMRHFADRLRREGVCVEYVGLESRGSSWSLTDEVGRMLARRAFARIVVTEPGDWRVAESVGQWGARFMVPVEIRPDDRFLCSRTDFRRWAEGRVAPRMEHFYRRMRRDTGWLMQDGRPLGGRWNYDAANRRALPDGVVAPAIRRSAPDALTREVMALTRRRLEGWFGAVDGFAWPVTRQQALTALREFVDSRLPLFGDYQDAMRAGDDHLFHSVLSPCLNIGLLEPREVCEAALGAWQSGSAPLHAVEGFIRQIVGWREYVRGIYWSHMPGYPESNHFGAERPLPQFYWTGETDMRCLREVIGATIRNAYAHHIQRLMVTGNFALLAGVAPAEVEEWYLMVYADAFEWVELPNTHGMALYADGGLLASKPYAASGAYINRMSNYCDACPYDPKARHGAGACPFTVLYWRFLVANEALLRSNPRMILPYRLLHGWSEEERRRLLREGDALLARLVPAG